MVKNIALSLAIPVAILFIVGFVMLVTSCLNTPMPMTWEPPRIENPFPEDGSLDQPFNLVLRWSAVPGNPRGTSIPSATITHYDLRLLLDNEGAAERTFLLQEPECEITDLAEDTLYRWIVRAYQSDGQSAESPEWTFKTKKREYGIPQISLIFPENGASDQATELILTWAAAPGDLLETFPRLVEISEFHVHITEDGAEEPTEFATVNLPCFLISGLNYGTSYRWYVVAKQSDGKTATSTEWKFQTAPRKYAEPSLRLLGPEDGKTNMDTKVTFVWDGKHGDLCNIEARADSPLEYDLFLRPDDQPYGIPYHTRKCEKTVSSLLYGTTYRWKVVTYQPDGQSAESEERSFRTKAATYAPPILALLYPENGQTDCASAITLSWQATPGHQTNHSARAAFITEYELYFYETGESLPLPIALTKNSHSLHSLNYHQEYRWKVIAHQSDGQRVESVERCFMTQGESFYPPEIRLMFPLNAETDVATTVRLSWEATPGGRSNLSAREPPTLTGFSLYFAKEGDPFDPPIAIEDPETREWEISGLDRDTAYHWAVEAHQSDGQSATSPTSRFRTIPPPIALYDSTGAFLAYFDLLSQSISGAPEKGLIVVRGGTVLRNEESELKISGKEITILGQPDNPFTIDMEGRGRVFHITNGASVTLENIEITGGSIDGKKDGGAIYLYGKDSRLTLRRAKIVGNRSGSQGGGIHMFSGALTMVDCEVINNEAGTSGGGIDARAENLRIENCLISDNRAKTAGGGLYIACTATIARSVVSNNTATRNGGGIYLANGALVAEETAIVMNRCEDTADFGDGGGIYVYYNGALYAEGLVIDGNFAKKNGGGIAVNRGTIAANRLTVSSNTALHEGGGGIFHHSSGGTLTTNERVWTQAGDRQHEFSVSSEGEVRTDGTRLPEDPVHVYRNMSGSESSQQMKW